MTRCLALTLILTLLLMPARAARAFSLLDFRNQADVSINKWFSWANTVTGQLRCPGGVGAPFSLSYRVDSAFMSNQSPAVQQSAPLAVLSALQSWNSATNNFVRFHESPWGTVTNCDSQSGVGCPLPCGVTRVAYEGPPFAEWSPCTTGGPTFCAPACWPQVPCPILPGWGANIDVFTRPNGFAICSNGFRYEMTPSVLGFTVVQRVGGDKVLSIDIYLNQSYVWTTTPNAARTPIGLPMPGCGNRADVHDPFRPADDDGIWHIVASSTVFDIETVVLHELGHALGLDHPNEACTQNAAQINPWTHRFDPCNQFDPTAVMVGNYEGVKRDLSDDDIGGISFLYRSTLSGDLDNDGVISILDAVQAIDFAGHTVVPSPYEVNLLDFRVRNGRVDADEAMQVVQWVIDPDAGRPNETEDLIKEFVSNGMIPPTQVTINATHNPDDIGLSDEYRLTVTIDNPNAVRFTAWDIDLVYDPAIFSNPRISNGSFLASGAWVSPGPDDGVIRFSKFGIGVFDDATSGTLGTITFDVDLNAAAASPDTIQFQYADVQLVTDTPFIHNYATQMNLPETLTLVHPEVMSYLYDADDDGVITVEDLYAFFISPIDVNKNMTITDFDRRTLQEATRRAETPDILTGR